MDPAVIGTRLASSAIAPLIKKLFAREGPGAGLVDKPVRLSALVSFKGEKRTLSQQDLRKLVRELTDRAARETHERPTSDIELDALTDALELTLYALPELDLDDVGAVRLGHERLAAELYERAGGRQLVRFLSQDTVSLYTRLLESACLHILHFLTQRSTFVARSLVEQSRQLDELITRTDIVIRRLADRSAEDAGFERRYEDYVAKKHSRLTINGIGLDESRDWPLDTAYLSLRASRNADRRPGADGTFAAETRDGIPLSARWTPPLPQSVEGVFASDKRVLLRGAAGSGKTTLVQWLAVTTARQDRLTGALAHLIGRVPFVLPLRTLTRGGASLPAPDGFLSAAGTMIASAQPAGWADRVLSAGRALMLIDGIDEVPEEERERTRRWLRDLLCAYPGNLWLVTSRPSAVREDWLGNDDFTDLTLCEMTHDNIRVFIRRWHEAAGADAALGDALLDAVRTKQDLGRLATNPLMCALICALHRERRGFLPRGRKALYDAALSMLLERRDRERDMAAVLDEETQIELLQRLAYWLIRNGRYEMDRADAVHQLERLLPSMPHVVDELGSAEDVLRHLLVRSGLLREPGAGAVDFVHRTFQDYLGARAAVEERDFDLLLRHAHLDQWEDVVRMAVAHARPDERGRLLRGLLKRGDKQPEHRVRLHLLAMACLEHAAKLDPEVRGKVERRAAELIPPQTYPEARKLAELGPIVLELLPGPEDVTSQQEAACVVSTAALVGGDAALPYLVKYRDHSSFSVRHQLGSHWDRFATETYAREIIAHLRNKPGATVLVRSQAELTALSRMGGHRSVDLAGDFTAGKVAEALDGVQVERLQLSNNSVIDDLEFVGRFRNLKRLGLLSCPAVSSLAPASGLPLKELVLLNVPQLDLSPLREFDRLELLSARTDTEWPVLELIPDTAPLKCVFPPGGTADLSALGKFASLYQLGLELDVPIADGDWPVLAGLSRLKHFGLNAEELTNLAASGVQLRAAQYVTVTALGAECDLRRAVEAFPSMTHLSVYAPDVLDLTPLRAHPHLRHVTVMKPTRFPDPAQLPDSVQLLVDGRPIPRH
ncbi:NACHT domain-containing protein [Streptomyces sp. NPDC050732]|uniref:NACHT domain-containing protein n=1 Tax=Streptomyces sp. NPDC050732 TaxID=3154632 RepID=UPI003418DD87